MASKEHLFANTYYIWSNSNVFQEARATLVRIGLEEKLKEDIKKNRNKLPQKGSLIYVGYLIFKITEVNKKSRVFFKKSEHTISVSFVAKDVEKLKQELGE